MSEQALSDIKVVDLTHHVAGPYATKLLSGFGAEVIKIEQTGVGDGLRSAGPFYRGEKGLERSIPFLWLNTGKKSVTLNLKTPRGVEILKQLVAKADLLVENFMPGVLSRLGIGYEVLREVNPRLVMTSISNFGQSGPYRDYEAEEITEYALSGSMAVTGDPERAPLAPGPAITQYTAAMWAYIASVAALYQREEEGEGRHVDLSIQECALDNIEIALIESLHLGKTPRRANDRHPMVPWELRACRDGHAAVIGGPYRHWLKAADLFEEPRLFEEKFAHALGRIEHRDEFEPLLEPWLRSHDKVEIFHAGQKRRLAFGYLASLEEVLASPQHEGREFFNEVDHPVAGRHRICGAPFRLSETPWQTERAPLLGEHNGEVLGGVLGYDSRELSALEEEGII